MAPEVLPWGGVGTCGGQGAILDWLQLPCPTGCGSWELKSLFLLGLDAAVNSPLPDQDLVLPLQPTLQWCLILSGWHWCDGQSWLGAGELPGVPWGGQLLRGEQGSSKEGTPKEGVRAAIPQLSAPLAVAISFLPAHAGVAPACPCALLRGCAPSPPPAAMQVPISFCKSLSPNPGWNAFDSRHWKIPAWPVPAATCLALVPRGHSCPASPWPQRWWLFRVPGRDGSVTPPQRDVGGGRGGSHGAPGYQAPQPRAEGWQGGAINQPSAAVTGPARRDRAAIPSAVGWVQGAPEGAAVLSPSP